MRYAAVLSLLIVLVPSCGTREQLDTTVQAAAVRTSLDTLWSQYADAADRRDSLAFGSLFFDDAVLVFSGAPSILGRSEIQTFLVSLYSGVDMTRFRVIVDDLRVHGPLAVETGTLEETYTEGERARTDVERFTLIAERDAGRRWRFRRLVAIADSVQGPRPPAPPK